MRYRKIPVEVEVRQFTDGADKAGAQELADWCDGEVVKALKIAGEQRYCIFIDTLEGSMRANPGDWIIKGVEGEFYPCRGDIFEQTYEKVETAPDGSTVYEEKA